MSHSPNSSGRSSKKDGKRKEPCKPRETQATRKKVQNRIAQRLFREKQAAYVHHLESLVETYQSSNELQDEESRYNKLHDRYLKLLDEHQQLKDATFLLKKKLMAVSNQIIAAANDEIFDNISNDQTFEAGVLHTSIISDPSEGDHTALRPTPDVSSLTLDPRSNALNGMPPPHLQDVSEGVDFSFQIGQQSVLEKTNVQTELGAMDAYCSQQASLIPSTTNIVVSMSGTVSDASLNAAGPFPGPIPYESSTLPSILYQCPLTVELAPPVIVKSSNVLAEKILALCRKNSIQLEAGRPYVSRIFKDRDGTSYGLQTQSLKRLAFAAVDLIAYLGGLQQHFRDTNLLKTLEDIVLWRISNGVHDRLAIPEPFRPTPLQCKVDHPLIVDFMNWPAIRDQMILYMENLDLDFMCRQIHLNAVVDLPSLEVSVNIYNILHSVRDEDSPTINATSYLQDPSWTFLELTPDTPYFGMCADPTDAFIESEISSRILNHGLRFESSRQKLPSLNDTFADVTKVSVATRAEVSNALDLSARDNDVVRRLRLHQFKNWRISREFARKHPFLDWSTAVADYETFPFEEIVGFLSNLP